MGAAAVFASGSAVLAGPPDAPADVDPSSLLPKLIRRTTYGYNDSEGARAMQLGYWGYLDEQLNFGALDDSACNARLAVYSTLAVPVPQFFGINPGATLIEAQEAAIIRKIFSRRQLYERMVEFWTDHFNVDPGKGWCTYLQPVHDRDVVRPHAMGNFGALLRATAESPAMLEYLDNAISSSVSPNENYARELMELHTLGVDGGYTQQDVREVARCFTGWEYAPVNTTPGSGQFRFTPARHDAGPKTLFQGTPYQVNIPAGGGKSDGDRVLTALLAHPSTSRHLATKLCRWFLRDEPTGAEVDRVAQAYASTGGDIRAMVRAALHPNLLAAAPPKFKRPLHYIASVMRAMPVEFSTPYQLRITLDKCGHQVFGRTTPDGYPDGASHWQGALLPRWNFAFVAAAARLSGAVVDSWSFFGGQLHTPEYFVERVDQGVFAGELPPAEKAVLRDYLVYDPWLGGVDAMHIKNFAGLAFSTASFQWY